VLHLDWKQVHDFLERSVRRGSGTLSELVTQFLARIREQVFEQDFAGVITKVRFGPDTGVFPESYLRELLREKQWHTPRPYKELDGTGRKLLLYDRNQKGITAEVEISHVKHIRWERAFPSRNVFARTPTIFERPISVERIRSIPGFEHFGRHRKDRSPFRNVTREQYRQLVEGADGK
jgi:hypothetical protein